MEKLLKQTEERMQRSIDAAKSEFATVRTGRATPGLLDRLRVNYYGTESPINQVATVSVPESRLLLITPWDKSSIPAIEKAILTSDLNLQPSSDGQVVRIAIPPLTEERRQPKLCRAWLKKPASLCAISVVTLMARWISWRSPAPLRTMSVAARTRFRSSRISTLRRLANLRTRKSQRLWRYDLCARLCGAGVA